ncbi:hypothetical protein BGW80DRAFT_1563409 [Lactifluus volemus]|nr:hypothetical protein BGW80DRAFT_1563409 [Lactifluus volemus]
MEEYSIMTVGNKTDLISDSDNATTTALMDEDALRLIDELVPSSDTRSTSRSPATPIDERDWLPTRVVIGSDDYEISRSDLAPTLPRTPTVRHGYFSSKPP